MLISFPVIFMLLAAAMLVGAVLGYLLNIGTDGWRRRYYAESGYYAQFRERTHAVNSRLARKIAELEATLAAHSVGAAPKIYTDESFNEPPSAAGGLLGAPPASVHANNEQACDQALAAMAPAVPPPPNDLTRIRGIDAALHESLRALGVFRFDDIESMSAIDELALEQRLRLPAGYITAEQWRLQARLLAADDARGAPAKHSTAPD
ncbi:MAG: hypothetical protein WC803_10385 [Sphingomonas sp.]|jgi:predicted flap endonuclease-1-like 5' DNA nuclease